MTSISSNKLIETNKTTTTNNNNNLNTTNKNTKNTNNFPNVEELRMTVPEECFDKSLPRSIFYLILDLLIIAIFYFVVDFVENLFGIVGLLLWYWFIGMFMFSLFVIGHDCGHGTFSNYTWVNDLFGHVAHGLIMVPYWPWQKSHRHHHQYTAHLDKDKSHPWVTEEQYETSNWLEKHFVKFPLSGFISWNIVYTIIGIPDGSHFWPWSKLFTNNSERIKCAISVFVCVFVSFVVFVYLNYSPWLFFKYYYMPVTFQGFWLVLITYLQHHDEQTEVYEEGTWTFVRGQLQTVDRSFGFGMDKALHNITDCHVVHHLFYTRIPHYNLTKATEAIKKVFEKYPGIYKRKNSYDFLIEFLWLNIILDCLVGKGSGLLKYRFTVQNNKLTKNKLI